MSVSFVVKLMKAWNESGRLEPKPSGGRRHAKLEPYRAFLLARVAERHDITMPELAVELEAAMGTAVALLPVLGLVLGRRECSILLRLHPGAWLICTSEGTLDVARIVPNDRSGTLADSTSGGVLFSGAIVRRGNNCRINTSWTGKPIVVESVIS